MSPSRTRTASPCRPDSLYSLASICPDLIRSVPAAPPPPAPTRLSVTVDPPDILLAWTPAADAGELLCYLVYVVPVSGLAALEDLAPAGFVPPHERSLHVPMVPPGDWVVGVTALGVGGESRHAAARFSLR